MSLVWCFHRRGQDSKRARKYKITWKKTKSTWWFKLTFLGWLSDPFKGLSDLQLGDEKGTLNHLARKIFRWVELESEIFFKFHYLTSSGGQVCTEDLIRTMFRTFHKPEFIGHPKRKGWYSNYWFAGFFVAASFRFRCNNCSLLKSGTPMTPLRFCSRLADPRHEPQRIAFFRIESITPKKNLDIPSMGLVYLPTIGCF